LSRDHCTGAIGLTPMSVMTRPQTVPSGFHLHRNSEWAIHDRSRCSSPLSGQGVFKRRLHIWVGLSTDGTRQFEFRLQFVAHNAVHRLVSCLYVVLNSQPVHESHRNCGSRPLLQALVLLGHPVVVRTVYQDSFSPATIQSTLRFDSNKTDIASIHCTPVVLLVLDGFELDRFCTGKVHALGL